MAASAILLLTFLVLCISSYKIGRWAVRFRILAVTGYLVVGIVAGPDILGIIKREDVGDLKFVVRIGLAYFCFAAGGEMYLPFIKTHFSRLGKLTLVLTASCSLYFGVQFAGYPLVPFDDDLSPGAVAMLAFIGATIALASSPMATIAVINKLRAKGTYAQTILGVTMFKDVVVILLFSLFSLIARNQLTDDGHPDNLAFIIIMGEYALSILLGVCVFPLLYLLLWFDASKVTSLVKDGSWFDSLVWSRFIKGNGEKFRGVVLLALGYGTYAIQELFGRVDVHIQYALTCTVAAVMLINKTEQLGAFHHVLHDISAFVFTPFFTFIGLSIDFVILEDVIGLAFLLFAVRLLSLLIGGYIGGRWADMPDFFCKISFLGYITQAGVGMALAETIFDTYDEVWAEQFTTMTVFVIVLGQILGPRAFKRMILAAGEARRRKRRRMTSEAHEDSEFGSEDEFEFFDDNWDPRQRSGFQLMENMFTYNTTTFPVIPGDAVVTVSSTISRSQGNYGKGGVVRDIRDIHWEPNAGDLPEETPANSDESEEEVVRETRRIVRHGTHKHHHHPGHQSVSGHISEDAHTDSLSESEGSEEEIITTTRRIIRHSRNHSMHNSAHNSGHNSEDEDHHGPHGQHGHTLGHGHGHYHSLHAPHGGLGSHGSIHGMHGHSGSFGSIHGGHGQAAAITAALNRVRSSNGMHHDNQHTYHGDRHGSLSRAHLSHRTRPELHRNSSVDNFHRTGSVGSIREIREMLKAQRKTANASEDHTPTGSQTDITQAPFVKTVVGRFNVTTTAVDHSHYDAADEDDDAGLTLNLGRKRSSPRIASSSEELS